MKAQFRHLATMTENPPRLAKFYQAAFGMKGDESSPEPDDPSRHGRPRARTVSDGHVGFNFNPRSPGRPAALDHFGIEVDDAEAVSNRIRDKYPKIKILKRPSNRPFAAIGTHDPAGNIFDLSQRDLKNRRGIYAQDDWSAKRYIDHFVLRVLDPPEIAKFYREIFELKEEDKALEDPNYYLTDGKVTLVINPWDITNFKGTGIERPSLDHVGFKVESIDAVKKDIEDLEKSDPSSAAKPVGQGPEREARLALLATCRYGKSQFADPDCVFIDIHE